MIGDWVWMDLESREVLVAALEKSDQVEDGKVSAE